MFEARREPSGVEAVERALSILDCFHAGDQWLPLKEIAARTGVNKATILRISVSLERFSYIRRREDGAFSLGPALWRLGALYRQGLELDAVVYPLLDKLVTRTGESCSFYVPDRDARVCLYRRNSRKAARHHIEEGERLPLGRGAGGRVLQAFAGAKGPLFERIRAEGVASAVGERVADVAGVAAPVFGENNRLIGALVISGLSSRFTAATVARLREVVREAAADLSNQLGASRPRRGEPVQRPKRANRASAVSAGRSRADGA